MERRSSRVLPGPGGSSVQASPTASVATASPTTGSKQRHDPAVKSPTAAVAPSSLPRGVSAPQMTETTPLNQQQQQRAPIPVPTQVEAFKYMERSAQQRRASS